MAKLSIKKATTDVTVYLFVQDSSKTTGEGLTGLAYNTASLVASYVRPLGSRTAITLATLAAVDSAHADGGFKEIDATNMPGVYRLDLPDAVCATGVNSAIVMLKGAANMAPVLLELQLTSYDPNDAVRLGMTALPNAAADAAGGLPISDAGGLDIDAQLGTKVSAIESRLTSARAGYLDKLNVSGALAHSDAAATYKADVSGLATSAALATVAGYVDTEVAAILAAVDIEVAAIKSKTDNLPASPAAVGSAMTLATNAITAAVIATDAIDADAIKADAITEIATGVWASATRTLSSFGTLVADIWASATRTLSSFGFTVATNSDANVTAIKAKTDNLPASPAAIGSAMTLTSGERTAIANEVEAQIINETDSEKVLKAITDKIAEVNPSLDDLTLAGIASAVRTELTTELARIDAAISSRLASVGYTAPDNASVTAIKTKTDNLPSDPADDSDIDAQLAEIKGYVDELETRLTSTRAGYLDKLNVSGTLAHSDAAATYKADVSGIPAAVWGHATRTLSSFGTLVSDIWSAATRTLSAFAFTVTGAKDASIDAIKAKTDSLPASPAAVGSAMTLTSGERTAIANEVETQIIDDTDAEKVLKAITDKIASVNPSLDDLTLAGIASAVRTELTTELARIDAAISSRLATAGYTAPNNAGITSIKAKTDNLPTSPAVSGEYTSALSAIQADLDNPNQYKADVGGLATSVSLTAVGNDVSAIKAKTDNLPTSPAAVGSAMTLANNSITAAVIATDAIDADAIKTDAVLEIQSGLATASALSVVAGYIDTEVAAIKAKTDNLPASPAASGEYTSELSAIQDDLDNLTQFEADLSGIPTAVWEHTARTLSSFGPLSSDINNLNNTMQSLPSDIYDELARIPAVSLSIPDSGEIVVYAGDTVDFQINGLGNLTDAEKVYFCAKLRKSDPDTSSILLIEKTAGLIRINASDGTPENGSITILDPVAGNIKVRLSSSESVKISEATYFCDVKIINSLGEAITKTQGEILFYYDITKAIS